MMAEELWSSALHLKAVQWAWDQVLIQQPSQTMATWSSLCAQGHCRTGTGLAVLHQVIRICNATAYKITVQKKGVRIRSYSTRIFSVFFFFIFSVCARPVCCYERCPYTVWYHLSHLLEYQPAASVSSRPGWGLYGWEHQGLPSSTCNSSPARRTGGKEKVSWKWMKQLVIW